MKVRRSRALLALAVACAAGLGAVSPAVAAVGFGPATNFAADYGSTSVAVGELNRDSKPDVGVPVASAAKPRLYRVLLEDDVRNEVTKVLEGVPLALGCVGSSTETHHFLPSAGLAPKPAAAPVASYRRLRFRVRSTSPSASASADTVNVVADAGDIGHGDCANTSYAGPGEGTFPRRMIGAETISVENSFTYAPVYGGGTLTLTRVD
jgi:hypothetical protein